MLDVTTANKRFFRQEKVLTGDAFDLARAYTHTLVRTRKYSLKPRQGHVW